ncbi:TPA: filamentous hemagglutinin N-terminal domain-containing protein [Burkholderia multivorans]|uniref:filamentous hemagglutinin N-terminal domain-containing protein n=1 Tax=Burkholderia multivorans TaxID=87883 RepID=UPI001C21025B|nr:filamentous hemagglutinin N-terminal domain-containing protein [Burkholderia multivorans]MBU9352348.1 filamentous hemagglutinin N-terminal domain-containing protein [Burkholderia multivorans]MBU9396197.1 filamentous hemagglutinin N-terminal domain-containing protein [Burkholderia multivorans]HDR9837109.1 filamentous hemagglutinin N-terminal domain-containing protein [Burkholderia multivorans]HDR9848132.1 filamentous hemagglutinin N-terminal domain-containing protein [Burkholderia multivorans
MQHTLQPHLPPAQPCARRALVVALACAMPLFAAHAQNAPLVVDPSAAHRPTLANGANGTPIVNIAAPDGAGLSHNRFTEYNVGAAGLVLNNSAHAVDTQLAGRIDGNTLLGGRPASVILNQVTGGNASMLAGATEVAGQAARVIVANPNGIGVNGGSFINANHVSLVAGAVEFDEQGAIRQFRTEHGRIAIDGAGLDARDVDQLDLVSRTLQVNAALHARRVTAVAQRGTANVEQPGSHQLSGQGDGAMPDVAIDVSKLGSMHASAITMHGSSAGVGVNLAGKVDAVTGGIAISSGGIVKVQDGGSLTADRLSINGNLDNAGSVRAGRALSAMGTLHNRAGGRIESGGTLSSMGSVRNAGTLHADAAMSLMGALKNERGARISSYGRINQMGHVSNAGELVQFAPRPTVTPVVEDKPASTAPAGVAGNDVGGSEGATAVVEKPVAPTAPIIAESKPVVPEVSTPATEKPVAPTAPVIAESKPALPEVSTPVTEKPVAPTAPIIAESKPGLPEVSTPATEKPVAPTAPVVAENKPVLPEVSTPATEKPVAPTAPIIAESKPGLPEVSTPVTEKPVAPTAPIIAESKPGLPEVSTPATEKPVAPTAPVVAENKPTQPDVPTPVTEKPVAPTAPVIAENKPTQPDVPTPVTEKPVAPAAPVIAENKPPKPPQPARPTAPIVAKPVPPTLAAFAPIFIPSITIPSITIAPIRPIGFPTFAFSPIAPPALPTFGMIPRPTMFAPMPAFSLTLTSRV